MQKKTYRCSIFFILWSSCILCQIDLNKTDNIGLEDCAFVEGIAIGDFNNDGYPDAYFSSPSGPNHLCKNIDGQRFDIVTSAAGVEVLEQSIASLWLDINNDSYLDLYVSIVNENDRLFINNGDETFTDITLDAGIYNAKVTKSVNAADFNNDGWIDIYVTNFNSENILWINQQNNTFQNEIYLSGALDAGPSMGTVCFDYDKDGDLDIFLVHDQFVPNILYQNDGSGRFTDLSEESGLNTIGYGMGADIGDINNDGFQDIYLTNLFQNKLFVNDGDAGFHEVSSEAQVDDSGMGWGTSFVDFDNDGRLDLFIANESQFLDPPSPNKLYRNSGNMNFETYEISESLQSSFGVVQLDFNLDGKLDLMVANRGEDENVELYENVDSVGNWIKIKLLGIESNLNGIGALLKLTTGDGETYFHEVKAGHGWTSQNSNITHIGLNTEDTVESLTVSWPSGLDQTFELGATNRIYTIVENGQVVEGLLFDAEANSSLSTEALSVNMKIYPNPVDDEFNIDIDLLKAGFLNIEFYDLSGQRLYHKTYPFAPTGKINLNFNAEEILSGFNGKLLFVKLTTSHVTQFYEFMKF